MKALNTPLNSKPIPQIGYTNYLALIGKSCSVRIRCQTFSVVMGEPDPIFWYQLLDQSGCFHEKVVVFGEVVDFGTKVVVILQSCCIRAKCLISGKSGCILV